MPIAVFPNLHSPCHLVSPSQTLWVLNKVAHAYKSWPFIRKLEENINVMKAYKYDGMQRPFLNITFVCLLIFSHGNKIGLDIGLN